MNKQSQNLMFNFFPLQSLNLRRSPISNKEAQTLYDIWKSEKDEYGKFIISESLDPLQVSSLTTKGIISSPPSRFPASLEPPTKAVEITSKGKHIIRNIILYTEKSALGKSSECIDYERIYAVLQNNIVKESGQKVASSFKWPAKFRNWLERAQQEKNELEPEKPATACSNCNEELDIERIRRRKGLCERCQDWFRPALPFEKNK